MQQLHSEGKAWVWGIWLGGGNDLVGVVGVSEVSADGSEAVVGYWLAEAAIGRGIITSALGVIIGSCFGPQP